MEIQLISSEKSLCVNQVFEKLEFQSSPTWELERRVGLYQLPRSRSSKSLFCVWPQLKLLCDRSFKLDPSRLKRLGVWSLPTLRTVLPPNRSWGVSFVKIVGGMNI